LIVTYFLESPADQANTTTAEITVEATADADKDDNQEEPVTLEAASDKQVIINTIV